MSDNFHKLKEYFDFSEDHEFLFVQVLQRKKEVKELGSNNRLIKSYYISSFEQLMKYKEEIIKLCDVFDARAYIHLSPRSNEKVFSEMLITMGNYSKSNNFKGLSKAFNSACGTLKGSKKFHLIDVDSKDMEYVQKVSDELIKIGKELNEPHLCFDIFPTKNGYHFITLPFNPYRLKEVFPEVDIHKNNPTILYCS